MLGTSHLHPIWGPKKKLLDYDMLGRYGTYLLVLIRIQATKAGSESKTLVSRWVRVIGNTKDFIRSIFRSFLSSIKIRLR